MTVMTKQDIEAMSRRAAVLEEYAEAREARAASWYGLGSSAYIRSLDVAERYRREVRELRDEIARARRRSA
ncbi:hypothetical protein CGZ95_08925 [Enemella evansiae]|nr:hypothetical protein CGZ95_08925 [Enemella evansiae]